MPLLSMESANVKQDLFLEPNVSPLALTDSDQLEDNVENVMENVLLAMVLVTNVLLVKEDSNLT